MNANTILNWITKENQRLEEKQQVKAIAFTSKVLCTVSINLQQDKTSEKAIVPFQPNKNAPNVPDLREIDFLDLLSDGNDAD